VLNKVSFLANGRVPTYWHYLNLEQLFDLQGDLEDDEAGDA